MARALREPDMIFFAGGEPSPTLFATEAIRRAFDKVLSDPRLSAIALQYSGSEGLPGLRDWVVKRMLATGVTCRRENVIITSGSQQGLDLAGRLFVDPGTPVYVQTPTYSGALQAFGAHGASFRPLPLDRDALEPEPRGMIYVMANAQNPSGRTLSLDERKRLLAVMSRLRLPLIEDDAYCGLHFDGVPPPSLMRLALEGSSVDEGEVIYLGTFSKTIAPGLRVGWMIAPAVLVDRLTAIKQGADLQTSALNQMVALEIADAAYGVGLERLVIAYRTRRDAMLEALEEQFGARATWTHPTGGFFVWLTLPEEIDASAELDLAIAAGVAYVPGQSFLPGASGRNTLRLSYSTMPPERIREGVRRLARVLNAAMERSRPVAIGAAR